MDMPSAESLVGWLLEHQATEQATELSDTDSLSSIDALSDSDSMSDEFEDLEGAFRDISVCNLSMIAYSFRNNICTAATRPIKTKFHY